MLCYFYFLTVLKWGDSKIFFKSMAKMCAVFKTTFERNIVDGVTGVEK